MFDLITGRTEHIPSTPTLPILVSVSAQIVVVSGLLAVSALWVTGTLPEIPTMMAFVAAPPPPPPPPPPPAPAVKRAQPSPERAPRTTDFVAPVDVPTGIEPGPADDEGFEGVPGGVEGGIPGGVLGGVVGGLPQAPPPPPPPPIVATRGPVRVGGNISTPALLHRVEPEYPVIAVSARLQGISILEAVVDEQGRVTDVRVLRTANPLLDRAAIAAVRQWQYAPLTLNGIPASFVLTVTLTFKIQDKG
jgi:protein TonB